MHGELMNFLRVMGCDQDETGKFVVSGDIVSFMGMGQEMVIGPEARFYMGGKPVPLAAAYGNTTGRGRCHVII